jgi:hypothetical protein
MPAPGEELGEAAGPAGGVQRHARLPAAEVLGHDQLVGSEQPAAGLLVIADGLLLVGGDGTDTLGEHATVPQLLVIQQRDALEAEQISQRVLIDHES